MTTATMTVQDRVAAGAAWLDEHRPGWWRPGRFDLGGFRLTDGCRCVVGQIYAAEAEDLADRDTDSVFDEAIEDGWLDLTFADAERMGFYDGGIWVELVGYANLQAEWTRLIEARRAESGAR